MELEHVFQQTGVFLTFQFLFVSSLFIPCVLGRSDIYRALAGTMASLFVTFGPMTLLLYVLYEVSRLG